MELIERIRAKEKIAGTMLRIERNPAIAYLVKQAKLDFYMFDCEHSNYSIETIHDMSLVANALGIATMARVPALSKDYISRMLDSGVTGIMVPMIETADQARLLVRYAKYPPLGDRGYTSTGAHTNYAGGAGHAEIMAEQNRKTIAIAQIETAMALENIDEIAGTDGIDVLLIGPNDLSISLGVPGDLTDPIELEAIRQTADAAHRHGKLFAMHSGPKLTDLFRDKIDFVMQGLDLDVLLQGWRGIRAYAENTLS